MVLLKIALWERMVELLDVLVITKRVWTRKLSWWKQLKVLQLAVLSVAVKMKHLLEYTYFMHTPIHSTSKVLGKKERFRLILLDKRIVK